MERKGGRGPVTLVPLDDMELQDQAIEPDASEVAAANLDDEMRQVEGLSVSVYKETGGPNSPMSMCFKKPRSDFPLLDDLKLYVQKHFGAGNYRAHFREGSRIKYNIPFSVVNDPTQAAAPVGSVAIAPQNNDMLRLLVEEMRTMRQEANLTKAQPSNTKADFIETVRLVKELLPPQQPGGAGGLSGLQEFLSMREMMRDELGASAPADVTDWKGIVKEFAPMLAGLVAGIAQRTRPPLVPVVPALEAPVDTLVENPVPMTTLNSEAKLFAQQLTPMRGQLQQLDTAATFKSDPSFMAETVLDMAEKQNPAMLPVLAGIAAPVNRENVLAALGSVIPASVERREWYTAFLDAVHTQLTPDDAPA